MVSGVGQEADWCLGEKMFGNQIIDAGYGFAINQCRGGQRHPARESLHVYSLPVTILRIKLWTRPGL